jgi:hypothetical protein
MQKIEDDKMRLAKLRGTTLDVSDIACMEEHGLFLHEGDWEKWQPCCYADGGYTEKEWNALRKEAMAMDWRKADTLEEKLRILWIQSRFYSWGEAGEWYDNYYIRQPLTNEIIKRKVVPWVETGN